MTPDPINDNEPAFDSSTPAQYDPDNSGVISLVRVGNLTLGAKITENAKKQYNELISQYRIQFKEQYGVDLQKDSGIKESFDTFANQLWFIDSENLQYFIRLKRWQKEGKPVDSLWLKAKNMIP